MKVGILTQPLHTNYGGLLQAFALQKVLREKFDLEVTTVNIQMDTSFNVYWKNVIKNFIKKYFLFKQGVKVFPFKPSEAQRKIIGQNSDTFIKNYIVTTSKISRYDKESLKKLQYDAYVVGSDQVWRPKYSPDIYTYFLDFIANKKDVLKISYAASFGVDNWEFKPEEGHKCSQLAKQFNSISVREDSAIDLCSKYLGVNATKVLDPTLLLEVQDYLKLIPHSDIKDEKDFVMFYVLDPKLLKGELVKEIKQRLKIPLFKIMPSAFTKETSETIEKCIYPPVWQWISGFYNAKYVVTDSFHGTAFSILFNKPFIALGNVERGMSRFTSLLKMFNLEDRLVTKISQLEDGILEKEIDFQKVNLAMSRERKSSLEFLKRALLK